MSGVQHLFYVTTSWSVITKSGSGMERTRFELVMSHMMLKHLVGMQDGDGVGML